MSNRKPINDVMKHLNKLEGYPTNVELKTLPKPLRYFGYFFISFFALAALIILMGVIIT